MEDLMGTDIPPFQEHALSHVILRGQLTSAQVGILRSHVQLTHSLETLLTVSARHPLPESHLIAATQQFVDSCGMVGSDPVVAEAFKKYELIVIVGQHENEP